MYDDYIPSNDDYRSDNDIVEYQVGSLNVQELRSKAKRTSLPQLSRKNKRHGHDPTAVKGA